MGADLVDAGMFSPDTVNTLGGKSSGLIITAMRSVKLALSQISVPHFVHTNWAPPIG
jgi:hypothetical protein